MKTSKNISLATLLTLLSTLSFAQEQEIISLVSSKNLHGATEVFVELHGSVQAEIWDKDYIRIVLVIKTNGVTKEVIKHLMTKKRFKISSYKTDENCLQLLNPNIELPVYINGRELKEDVNYQIFVPRNVSVTIKNDEEMPETAIAIKL